MSNINENTQDMRTQPQDASSLQGRDVQQGDLDSFLEPSEHSDEAQAENQGQSSQPEADEQSQDQQESAPPVRNDFAGSDLNDILAEQNYENPSPEEGVIPDFRRKEAVDENETSDEDQTRTSQNAQANQASAGDLASAALRQMQRTPSQNQEPQGSPNNEKRQDSVTYDQEREPTYQPSQRPEARYPTNAQEVHESPEKPSFSTRLKDMFKRRPKPDPDLLPVPPQPLQTRKKHPLVACALFLVLLALVFFLVHQVNPDLTRPLLAKVGLASPQNQNKPVTGAEREKLLAQIRQGKQPGSSQSTPQSPSASPERDRGATVPPQSGSVSFDQRQGPPQASRIQETPPPMPPRHNSSSTLGILSQLRGERLILEQQLRIAELKHKLAEVKGDTAPKVIIPEELSRPPVFDRAKADDEKSKREEEDFLQMSTTATVVSIQGANGRYSALVRTPQGKLVTLRSGSSFMGGIVTVTKIGVSVRNKKGEVKQLQID